MVVARMWRGSAQRTRFAVLLQAHRAAVAAAEEARRAAEEARRRQRLGAAMVLQCAVRAMFLRQRLNSRAVLSRVRRSTLAAQIAQWWREQSKRRSALHCSAT